MQHLKHPRTLTEAFGPYASGPIEDPVADRGHAVVTILCTALAGVLAALVVAGVL